MLKRISAIAIVAGFAASFLVSVLVVFIGTLFLGDLGASDDLSLADLEASLATDTPFVAISLIGALASAFAAGYAAAWVAPGDELANAFAVGFLLLAISAAGYEYFDIQLYPLWYTVPAFALTIPLSLLGGWVRRGPSAAA